MEKYTPVLGIRGWKTAEKLEPSRAQFDSSDLNWALLPENILHKMILRNILQL
jgi:hypothetical protein